MEGDNRTSPKPQRQTRELNPDSWDLNVQSLSHWARGSHLPSDIGQHPDTVWTVHGGVRGELVTCAQQRPGKLPRELSVTGQPLSRTELPSRERQGC